MSTDSAAGDVSTARHARSAAMTTTAAPTATSSTRAPSPKHRAPGNVMRSPYASDYLPTHCAGDSCFHAHPGEPAWGVFAGIDEAVIPACCDRKTAHGAHDFTGGRCPGVAGHSLPAPAVVQRAARVRDAIRGAR